MEWTNVNYINDTEARLDPNTVREQSDAADHED